MTIELIRHVLTDQTTAIGYALAINGFWSIACQMLLLTRIRRLLGISLAYKLLSLGWILVWLLLPLLRNVLEATETPLPVVDDMDYIRYPAERGWWTAIAVNLMLSFVTFVGMSGSLLMVLVNMASPDKTAYGAVNGIGTAVGVSAASIQNCRP